MPATKARASPGRRDTRQAELCRMFMLAKPSPASLMWLGCEALAEQFSQRAGFGVVLPRHVRDGWRWRLRMVLGWAYAAGRAQREGASERERSEAEDALRRALERFAAYHAQHVLPRIEDRSPLSSPLAAPPPSPRDEGGAVIAFPSVNPRSTQQ
jgi:hypothetical protein